MYVFCSAVEDILRKYPELKDMRRPADNHTPLHIACVNSRLHTVRHLALSVSSTLATNSSSILARNSSSALARNSSSTLARNSS